MNAASIFPRDKQAGLVADAMMRHVMYAMLPAVLLLVGFVGCGVLIQLLLAMLTALACEWLCAVLRGRRLTALDISSGCLTATLLAVSVPAIAPWWVIVSGTAFALFIGKHVFGGVGMNIFNPAMVGFCAVYLSFPAAMSLYPSEALSTMQTLAAIFPTLLTASTDAVSGATVLSAYKANHLVTETKHLVAYWINFAWLLGGAYLWRKKLADWRLSVAFFASFSLGALLFWLTHAQSLSPLTYWHGGALVFTTCFIITDPTSAATSRLGRVVFAALAGILAILIRQYSNMADSMAFAVLLANCCAPMIDSYTRPQYFRGDK